MVMFTAAQPKLPQRPERQAAQQPKRSRVKVSRLQLQLCPCSQGQIDFCIVALASMCFVVLYRFSILSDLNATMNRMNEEYNALRNENRLLKVEIETNIDLDRVKQVAETEMGMHKPDRYQIVPVSVPKNDYNVVLISNTLTRRPIIAGSHC